MMAVGVGGGEGGGDVFQGQRPPLMQAHPKP